MGRRTDVEIAAFLISTWGAEGAALDGEGIVRRLVDDDGWREERARRTVARLAASGSVGTSAGDQIVVASSPCLLSGGDGALPG